MKLADHPDPVNMFRHLAAVWALPMGMLASLWNDGEVPIMIFPNDRTAFPTVERPFRIGTELLLNASGSKAYTIARPSEVLLHVGDIKSVVLKEALGEGCIYIYKVRYRDDSVDETAFASGSLRVTSYARPGKLFTASSDLITTQVGMLKAESMSRIVDAVVALRTGTPAMSPAP